MVTLAFFDNKFIRGSEKMSRKSSELEQGRPLPMTFISGNTDEFWLQKTTHTINWIQAELQLNTDPGSFLGDVKIGDRYSVLRIEDDCFYRGRVENIQKNLRGSGNVYKVRFVDYGNVVKVFKGEIHTLPENLCDIPDKAFRCTLKTLITPTGNFSNAELRPSQLEKSFQINRNLYAALWRNVDKVTGQEPDYFADIARKKEALENYINTSYRPKVEKEPLLAPEIQSVEKVKDWLQTVTIGITTPQDSPNESFQSYESSDEDEITYERALKIPTVQVNEENGSKVECVIEHIESPGLFYVHLTGAKYKGEMLENLSDQLSEYLNGKKVKVPSSNYVYGDLVAVREMQDAWIRGQIEEYEPSDDTFKVFLIDYGDTIYSRRADLRYLPAEFGNAPKFALPCSLKGIKPLSGLAHFSPEATNAMKKLALDSIHYFIFDLKTQDLPLDITLFSINSSTSLNDALANDGLVSLKQRHKSKVENWDPMTADFFSPSNVPTADNDYFPAENNAKPEERLCKFFRGNGRCARGRNCKFLHVQTGSSFFAADDETVMTVAHHETTLEVGSEVYLEIPVVRHPSNFYAIFLTDPDMSSLSESTTSKNASFQLHDLNQEMTRYYHQTHLPNTKMPHIPGEIVAAKYSDERWYRARIIDVIDEEDLDNDLGFLQKVRVFFVDFGRCWNVDILSIREILPQYLQLPFQAVECSLANIVPYKGKQGDEWPLAVREEFRRLTASVRMKAEILSDMGGRLELKLLAHKETGGWMDVAQALIDKKLASNQETVIQPRGKIIIPG